MSLQIQDIKKGKETSKELWCTKCKIEGHHKHHCPAFLDYLASGAPNPLNSQGMSWSQIYQTRGHMEDECFYLQKIVTTAASLYCKFFQLVSHDENDYRAY